MIRKLTLFSVFELWFWGGPRGLQPAPPVGDGTRRISFEVL